MWMLHADESPDTCRDVLVERSHWWINGVACRIESE